MRCSPINLNHLNVETFRKGWAWKPKFVVKCRECDEEYQQQIETCGSVRGQTTRQRATRICRHYPQGNSPNASVIH